MINDKPIAYGRTAEVYAWKNNTILKLFYDWVPTRDPHYEATIHQQIQKHSLPHTEVNRGNPISTESRHCVRTGTGARYVTALFQKLWLLPRLIQQWLPCNPNFIKFKSRNYPL